MNGEITPKPHKGQNPMDRVVVHEPNEPLERTFFALTYEAQLQSWLPELYVISGHYISKKLFINKREDKEVFVQIEERCYINSQLFNLYLLREVWKNKSESDRGREIILRNAWTVGKKTKESHEIELWCEAMVGVGPGHSPPILMIHLDHDLSHFHIFFMDDDL